MKRMYVREEARGLGAGKLLTQEILLRGNTLGYKTMRLDTLERLQPAIRVYEQFGFRRIEAYCHNPLPNAVFMEVDVTQMLLPVWQQGPAL